MTELWQSLIGIGLFTVVVAQAVGFELILIPGDRRGLGVGSAVGTIVGFLLIAVGASLYILSLRG